VSGRLFLDDPRWCFPRVCLIHIIQSLICPSGMHDPTEGGVAGALHEVADCAGKGFTLYAENVPVSPAARRVCEFFDIDPLYLISSGAQPLLL
jgi:hydrogenase expression/formation protein HypE